MIDYEEPNQHGISNDQQEAEEIPVNQLVTTPKKRLRYPGDVQNDQIANMTPRTTIKAIRLLKRINEKKTKTIKRLCTQIQCQKKKLKVLVLYSLSCDKNV